MLLMCFMVMLMSVKRDMSLFKKVRAGKGDQIPVLDIFLGKNRDDIPRLSDESCNIDMNPAISKSLQVSKKFNSQFALWVEVGV